MTFVLYSLLFRCWTMGEGHMPVCNVIKELNLLFLEQKTGSDGMNRSVAPSLIEESTIMV